VGVQELGGSYWLFLVSVSFESSLGREFKLLWAANRSLSGEKIVLCIVGFAYSLLSLLAAVLVFPLLSY